MKSVAKYNAEVSARGVGRCSCDQALWYLDIIKRINKIHMDQQKFAGSFSAGECLDQYESMIPEIRRAIRFGTRK